VTAGSAPTLSVWVNTPTNQLGEYEYDANGNQLTGLSSQYFTYDSENRMIGAYTNGSDYVQYAYDSQNKRVFSSPYASGSQGPQHVYFYGVDGQQLGAYPLSSGASALEIATYFGSKRLGFNTNPSNGSETATAPDRLGSYGQYYPWGESKSGNNPADIWSYATYWRDSLTGLDYANQRYYSNVDGRFMTPDSYKAFGLGANDPKNPQSWNHYAYVVGDPVNGVDPTGQDYDDPDDLFGPLPFADPGLPTGDWSAYFLGLAAQIAAQVQATLAQATGLSPGPSCSITEFSRGTPRQTGGPANHTYIQISDPALGTLDILEGVPTQKPKFFNPFGGNWGNLYGQVSGAHSFRMRLLLLRATTLQRTRWSRP